jgi:CRP/FNR family transcriptional regulator, anaerobic regulatory protein
MKSDIQDIYGFMFESELIDEIVEMGKLHHVKEGEVIIDYGQNLKGMPLLLDGAIKIFRKDNDGDELALYFLEIGDSCTMTMNCCIGQQTSKIKAVAETDAKFVTVPAIQMKEWMKKYQSWMAFVFESYNNRFNEMLEAIDNLAFNNMNDRLYKYLKDQVLIRKATKLQLSHQDIAYDLNTSRVVISRLLKSLENDGFIELGRNNITVIEY